jgi:superfamily I DNA/RNA helicase
MDTVELARQAAERLHLAGVAAGRDPWKSYDFARAEAARRSIDVEKLPKGDIRLRGARALYDPGSLTILHEDAGDDFVHAFLVSHEIGHVELGGAGEPSITMDADPTRSAESAPIGMDRVVDYSRRERREVQMDLFGREFLLPRSVARRLHVEGSVSASEIARRLAAPFAVVAQQLLDALLLPQVSADPGVREERPLNKDQKDAAEHSGSPYLLEAGPGTGKTQTLVGRVEWLLSKNVSPEKILVLTFSNKAAGEMSDRIAAKNPKAAAAMWIGTFHAFGLDIVRRFHNRLKLPPNPRLMDRAEAIDLLADGFPRLRLVHYQNLWDPAFELRDILAAISRAKDEVVDAKHYAELAEAMRLAAGSDDGKKLVAEKAAEVAKVFKYYEDLKRENKCVDFGDLVDKPVRLLETDDEVRGQLSTKYEHVLVDEFQDVNRASVRLLKAICGSGKNLWVVGDIKQSIYRFRGASSVNVVRFGMDDFPGGKRGRLKVNYRSTEEIVTSFVGFAKQMKAADGTDVTLKADRGPSGVKPQYRSVGMAPEEVAAIADAIEEFRVAGIAYRDQALLCTGNERLARIGEGLESLGIPVLYLGSLFERDEIQELISLLSVLTDRRAMGVVRIGTMKEFAMSLADVAAVVAYLKQTEKEPLSWLDATDEIPELRPEGKGALKSVKRALDGFDAKSQPWIVTASVLLDRTTIAAEIAKSDAVAVRARGVAIWQFMNFVKSQPPSAGLPISRLLDRIRRLVLLSDERDLRELPAAAQGIDAVRLMTIHGSKGLEFKAVHIPGMNSDTIPRSPNQVRGCPPPDGLIEGVAGSGIEIMKAGHVEEQECLFFVALSRARDRLLLYSPTAKSNGTSRPRSAFVDKLGGSIDIVATHPARALPLPGDTVPIPMAFPKGIRLTDHKLALFQRCPRRFFYTHILEVGGRRSETAFMQMHVAVRSVVEWLTADPNASPPAGALDAKLAEAWDVQKLGSHGYSDDYKRIAKQLVAFFVETREGFKRSEKTELRLSIAGSEIFVRPDEILTGKDGKLRVRAVRTGHVTSKELEKVAAAVFTLAAQSAFPGCTVEFVHLSDGTVTPVPMKPKTLENRRKTAQEMLSDIAGGNFPKDESPMICPRCPAFFICGPVPPGKMQKEFGS